MKLTLETINQINLFEKTTGARVKDSYLEGDTLVFLIEEGNIKKALGKDNSNIKRLEAMFKKRIKLLSFSSDPVKFINNILYPVKADNIEIRENTVVISAKDTVIKGKIFGRERTNLARIKALVKKYYNIQEVVIQ